MTGRAVLIAVALLVAVAAWGVTCLSWRYRELADDTRWLEPRSFDGLGLVLVGTGTAYENPHRLGPATLVGTGARLVLVDAGRGVSEALRAAEIPVYQPDTVFLTSLLPENTVGLDDLLLTGWIEGRTTPLQLVGPPGTRALAQALTHAHTAGTAARARSLGLPVEGAQLNALEVRGGWSAESGPLHARAAALTGGPLPTLAWRFEADGRSLVVGGSGWGHDELAELARGADALVHDGFWSESLDAAIEAGADDPEQLRREAALLTPLRTTGEIATRAGVSILVLTRLRPPPLWDYLFERTVAQSFAGRVLVADDGDAITLRSRASGETAREGAARAAEDPDGRPPPVRP